jgi:hypothetical protein
MLRSFWAAAQLAASQEGLSSVSKKEPDREHRKLLRNLLGIFANMPGNDIQGCFVDVSTAVHSIVGECDPRPNSNFSSLYK